MRSILNLKSKRNMKKLKTINNEVQRRSAANQSVPRVTLKMRKRSLSQKSESTLKDSNVSSSEQSKLSWTINQT
jgi:hypothetical protein